MTAPATFTDEGKRIKVKIGDAWHGASLHSMNCRAILPQYFAKMDSDGTMRDLRNDCYAVDDATA